MASMITHRVVGEIAFRRWGRLDPDSLGPFLLGNILVDLHFCGLADRIETHFSRPLVTEGPLAFDKSCENMLARLGTLLVGPWAELSPADQAFVAGYLCHLAADEESKRFDMASADRLGYRWWRDISLSPSVVMTIFDAQSHALSPDPQMAAMALGLAQVPDVFAHVSHHALQRMWQIVRFHALGSGTVESYLGMLRRLGQTGEYVEKQRCDHQEQWAEGERLVATVFGDVETRLEAMVSRALVVLPELWR